MWGAGKGRDCVLLRGVMRSCSLVRDRRTGSGEGDGELLSMPLDCGLGKRSRWPAEYGILTSRSSLTLAGQRACVLLSQRYVGRLFYGR